MRFGECPLSADDALGDSRLGDEEGASDLVGGQASEQAEGERHPRLGREHGMAGDEHQAQQVVANVVVKSCFEVFHLVLAGTDLACPNFLNDVLATELFVLVFQQRVAAEVIDGAMFGSGHQPRARVVGDTRLRPLFECGDESVLCQVLGHADVAHDTRQPGDEPGRLDPPDGVDGAMGVGSCHCYRSHHL